MLGYVFNRILTEILFFTECSTLCRVQFTRHFAECHSRQTKTLSIDLVCRGQNTRQRLHHCHLAPWRRLFLCSSAWQKVLNKLAVADVHRTEIFCRESHSGNNLSKALDKAVLSDSEIFYYIEISEGSGHFDNAMRCREPPNKWACSDSIHPSL
jgi:hypothetical protein